MTQARAKAKKPTGRTARVKATPFLRAFRKDVLWCFRATWLLLRWLARSLAQIAHLTARGLGALARWAAAKPQRAMDVAVGGVVAVSLAGLAIPASDDQVALVTPEKAPGLDYSSSLDCMALNIYHEARGEPRDGQLAVAQVVMNRVKDPRFPNTVCGVVQEGGENPGCQFSWWCDGRSDRPTDRAAWQESLDLAQAVLDGKFDDPTGGALWYHADHVQPAWRMAITKGPKIGRHIFYASATE